jgi:hypothetical protein
LALGSTSEGNFLYAADPKDGRIDVFTKDFGLTRLAGSFTDPNLPAGFTPFNIQNVNGKLFVTYQNSADLDHGGVVDVFDTSGRFLQRFAAGGSLNAPWGLAVAPPLFGPFGNALLVGNFGDGHISAFNATTGAFLGQLSGEDGQPLAFERAWGLKFGNGATAGDGTALYVTAGIHNQHDGLLAVVRPETPTQRFVAQAYLDLLHRPVDAVGRGVWANALAQGATREQVAQGIASSLEFRTNAVQALYGQLLHRGADAAGLAAFTQLLATGGTVEQVEGLIAGSPEYFQSRGGGSASGFLAALYQDTLSRPPDGFGQATFLAALAGGASPAQVAGVVLASQEFREDLVQGFYQRLLGRPADGGGLSLFTGDLGQGVRDEQVLAALVGSQEYFAHL